MYFQIFFSHQKNIKTSLEIKRKSLDDNKHQNTEITSNKFGKNIKATVKVHNNNCCQTKLNNSMYNFNVSLQFHYF
jgi:hypothetical protein